MLAPLNTTSTTVFQNLSGSDLFSAAAVGDVGLSAQSLGAVIEFTTFTLNAFGVGVDEGGQTGVNVWLDIDAPNDFFDRFIQTSGSLVTFNAITEAGVTRAFSKGEGSITFSPLLPANDDRPFAHFEVTLFEPVTSLDPGVDTTFIVPGDAVITLGMQIFHIPRSDTQYDPDLGSVHIEFTSDGPLPDLPRQFTAAQKAKFQSDADDLNTIANGLGALDVGTNENPAASLANLVASQAASAISPQVGNANSALQSALSLTDALISVPTNPVALPLSLASALANGTAGILQLLAADPPDGNYLEVFAAPDWSFGDLVGVSAQGNALVQDTWALFQESLNLLAAAERFQGADLAGADAARALQEAAFDAALARFALQRVAVSSSLTAFLAELQAGGVMDLDFQDDTSLADVQALLAGLGDPATDEPTLAAWIASVTAAFPGLLAEPGPGNESFLDLAIADALATIAGAGPSGATGSVFAALDLAATNLATTVSDPGQTIIGTLGDDNLSGGEGADLVQGGDGADRLVGNGGNDTLEGGDGADTLNGGDGDDSILGGATSADLRDVVFAGAGSDSVDGGFGNDELNGMGGNDTLAGGFGVDTVAGGFGDDVITGSAFSDLVFGNAGNDFVNGGFGSDRVNGGTGADRFFHLGIQDHGSDWIQDYTGADGDVLLFGQAGATADQFQVNAATTNGAGDAGVAEAFVIYRPTGQIMWALVDGMGNGSINLQIAGNAAVFDLLA